MTTLSTIAERVNAMHQARAAGQSGGPDAAFAREQAELAATPPAGVAPVGTVLPDASLLDPTPLTGLDHRERHRRHRAPLGNLWVPNGTPGGRLWSVR
jgi:hypothetical protein